MDPFNVNIIILGNTLILKLNVVEFLNAKFCHILIQLHRLFAC